MTNSQRLAELRKKREEEKKSSSSTTTNKTYKNSDRLKKIRLERDIDFDTFEADLNSLGTTIQGIYDGWQPQDKMSKTKTTVEAMQARIKSYQDYQKIFGGADLSELANSYKSVLDNWDNISSVYSQYKDADSYTVAKKNAMYDEQFKGLTYDDVQSKLKEYAADSDEYKYLSGYTNYSDLNDFNKAIENAKDKKSDYYKNLETKRNVYKLDGTFDLYKHYMDAEDYKEKSEYKPSKGKKDKWWQDTSDNIYEYINDFDGKTRTRLQSNHDKYQVDAPIYTPSEYADMGLDYLTDDEIGVYNYIYATKGKSEANKFLSEMKITLNKRATDETTEGIKKAVDDSAVTSALLSIASIPMNVGGAIYGAVESLSGENNPYSIYHGVSNIASDVRAEVGSNIAEKTKGLEILGQNVPSFLYNTGMSIGDSVMGIASFGKFYTPLMGMSAYQQKSKELTEAGEDENTIFYTALASGAAEAVFEYMSIDQLLKIKNVDSFINIVKAAFIQAGVEGSEELFTETANILADTFIRGDSSELSKLKKDLKARGYSDKEINTEIAKQVGGQIGWAFAGGALSGGVMGSGASVNSYSEMSSLGKSIKGNERTADMLDIAGLTPQESEAYKAYTRYANKGINADNISNARLGNLYATTEEGARNTLRSKKTSVDQKTEAVKTLDKLSKVVTENKAAKISKELTQNGVAEENSVTSSGENIDIAGIKLGEDTKVVTADGKEISISDITPTQKDADLLAHAQLMSESDANLFIEQYDGQTDVSEYADSFNLVMEYAKHDFTQDTILENKGVLSNEQVSAIYGATVINQYKEKQSAIDKLNAKHGKAFTIQGKVDDSVIDYDNTGAKGKVAWNSLNSSQRKAITFMKGIAKGTGMNLRLISNGMELGINGAFEIKENTIVLDIYAGMDKVEGTDFSDAIIPTASHEMTHWMKEKSPALYRKIDEFIFKSLMESSGLSEADILNQRRRQLEKNHPNEKISDETVRDEVIARACEDMLAMSEEGKKIFNSLSESEQKTFVDKIKDIIQNLKDWVNDLLSQYKSNSPEAREMRKYQDRLNELSKMWDEMLRQSIQANQSLQKEGITGEELANKTSYNVQEMAREKPNIDKYGYNADNISRANKQGELVNDYYYALSKKEWKIFYDKITKNGYLATANVGVVAPIVVNDKLVVAERLYTGKDAHDYVVTEAYKLFAEDGDNYTLSLLQDALNKGDIDYDTQRIFSFVNRLNRSYGRDELLTRYNRNNSRFDIALDNRKQGKSNSEIHRDSQETIAREGLSFRDKSSVQEVDEIKRSDRDFNYIQTLQSAVNELRNILTEMQNSEDFKVAHDKLSEAVSNGDVENGIKAYKEWQEKSGYAELSQRRDALQLELDNLRKSFEEDITNKELEKEKEAIAKSGLSEADYFRKQAVKEFGYTPYFYDAGYITPNGKMLNFSGEKGKHYGTRGQDHRAIGIIYANTNGTAALNRFIKDGNIRIMAESPGIDISTFVEPTTEQYSTIRKFIYEYANKEYFNVDLTDENGNVIGSLEYENKINPLRIINDIKHYYATGEIREQSNIDKFRYSDRDNDIDVDTQINQSMTMAECKDMIQRAFVLGEIYEWYDGEYKNGEEWLKAQGVDEVALYIENEYRLQEKYLDKIEGINEEIFVNDILEAYLNGTLVGKEKPKPKRLDTAKEYRINDKRFYSPQRIRNVKKLLDIASTRVTDKNRAEVSNARAKILLFAHNKGASELLGLTQAELNKKLRTWGGYPANARDISRRFNNGVADSNKWTGIENCSWLYRSTVTTKDLESLVKEITGTASDYEKLYIARTMLALDTHIDWSWLSFDFDSYAGVQEKYNGKSKVLGFYRNDARKIVVSRQNDTQNTVAHEMGHALDYQWGRDLDFSGALTEAYRNTERITDAETKQFFDNFKIFIDSLTDSSDISSEYKQDPKEVFARFVAKFIQWVDNTGTGGRSYNIEYSYYKDNFTASQYIEFVKLLQEKAMLDSKKVAEGGDVKFSDRDTAYMDAVNNDDMETAQRLVDEAAKANGYTQRVMHGTTEFGFTKFEGTEGHSYDEIQFFATDSIETAGTYSMTDDVRRIGGKEGDWFKTQIKDCAKDMASFMSSEVGNDNYTDSKTLLDIAEIDDYKIAKLCRDWMHDVYENKYSQEKKIGFLKKYKTFEDFNSSDKGEELRKKVNSYRLRLRSLVQQKTNGIYEFYANTDNLFVMDGKGAKWDELVDSRLPENRQYKTRDVCLWAKEQGYSGVLFKNIIDNGTPVLEISPANVYAFFNPREQVKSADPVTYDSNGNVIPLSERFNAKNEDIRYSDRDIEVYDRTAILKETTIDKYLRDYASKTSPNYAQAYITYMSPDRFLKMTTSYRDNIEAQSKEFNYDEFTEATLFQPIQLIIDSETGEVNGHEGRHRMVALSNAGVYNVPVLMFDYSNKTNKENISEMVLHGQFNSYLTTRVQDVIPFSYSNREEIIKKFGTQSSWQKMKERYDKEKTLMYSDRDNVSVYNTMGETDRLIKENTQLKEDVERLKERLKLEKQITHGNHFNENQLEAVAAHIRSLAKSNYSKPNLVNLLKGVYSYIATSKDLNWQDMFAQCYDIASMVLEEAKPVTESNDYYKMILRDIQGAKISVNEHQRQNAKYRLDNRWHNKFFNKIKITDNAISLDSQWQEWASAYPDIFDAEISDADQLVELYYIYDSLKEGSEIVVEYDTEEQTRWLAREIYNQYWNVSPIRTTAEKYNKQIKLLNFKHREAMNQLRNSYKDRLKTQHEADKKKAAELVKQIRDRKDKEIEEVKQKSKERMDAYKDNAARKTKIQSITTKALSLSEWLLKNSKEKHIHESLKGPVANLLQAIDFSSKQLLGMRGGDYSGMPTRKDISLQKSLSQVKDMMLEASVGKEELIDLYGHDLDDDIKLLVESVDDIMRTVGDNEFILNKMTLNDLNTLDNMLKTIKQAVTQMNQFHSVHHAKGIASLGQEEIRYAEKLGNEKVYVEGSLKSGTMKMVKWTNSVPYYAFKRFGEAGKKIFEAFQDGWDTLSFNVKAVIDFTKKTYTSKEVKTWEKEVKSFDVLIPTTDSEKSNPNYKPRSQKVKMTTAQVMYLYLLNKRASAKAHLLGGGIVVSNIETKKSEVISQPEGAILEQSEIDKIIKSLTPRQIAVADALSYFMNTVCSEWGNEVSMARFGYKAFGEPDYVPMQVDKDEISTADPAEKNNSLFKLLNMSFTKSLTEGANNRLVISSIFDVFAQHTSDMAKYNALALPVLDAFKWYNYKEIEYVGNEAKVRNTVKKSIGKAFGKDGQSYITTLLEDINGQNSLGRDKMSVRFFKNSKLAAVGMNLRVMLLQPTSYFRASANIDNKYLIKALVHKPKIAHAEKYCGMALWKSLGYYDTNIQRGVAEQIKHAETGYDKLVEWSMKGAGNADRLTLGYLWNASELEIRKTRTDLKVGSEEFFFEVGKRLRDIIYSTQVVDSTLTRSEFMRSPDGRDKILSMFASEPTLAYNILQDAYIQTSLDARELGSKKAAFKKNGKKIARAITAYTITNAVAALVESGFDILRDDDEEEEIDIAEFMKLYLANFAADMSIIGKIPYLKDGLSILQGYSPSRSDVQWMESAYKTYTGIAKHLQGEGNPVTTIKNGLKTFSYVSGLPFFNAYRDAMAALDKMDILSSEELEEMFKDLFGIE